MAMAMVMATCQGRVMAAFLVVMVCLGLFHHTSALVYNVGDRAAWTLSTSVNYNRWAASKAFRVNDVLRFSYSSEIHNVMMVSKADYLNCKSGRPIAVYANGNTLVRLSRKGTYFFICGIPGHCQGGMKMTVTVH